MDILDGETTRVPIDSLKPHPRNPRQGDVGAIHESIKQNGWYGSVIVQRSTGYILAGNHRWQAARHAGAEEVPVTYVDVDDEHAVRILLADNRTNDLASYEQQELADLLTELADGPGLDGTGYDGDDLDALLADLEAEDDTPDDRPAHPTGPLTDRFVVPPFSILDTRQGYWQERKRSWLSLGIQSEVGRDAPSYKGQASLDSIKGRDYLNGTGSITNLTGAPDLPEWAKPGMARMAPGTSIFDPVLTEILVAWYSPTGGTILDPFAGGSVRGIVSSALGRTYHGIDLREEQVAANREQWDAISPRMPRLDDRDAPPTWTIGDSLQVLPTLTDQYDMILTCPPYGDLERYSDEAEDLSTMTLDDFQDTYERIMVAAVDRLRDDRFAAIVVSEYRGPDGGYTGLVPLTISIMQDAGMAFYSDAILVNPVGTLALRASAQFDGNRKILRSHQNVLVFAKGDARAAAKAAGPITPWEPPDDGEDADAYVPTLAPEDDPA